MVQGKCVFTATGFGRLAGGLRLGSTFPCSCSCCCLGPTSTSPLLPSILHCPTFACPDHGQSPWLPTAPSLSISQLEQYCLFEPKFLRRCPVADVFSKVTGHSTMHMQVLPSKKANCGAEGNEKAWFTGRITFPAGALTALPVSVICSRSL